MLTPKNRNTINAKAKKPKDVVIPREVVIKLFWIVESSLKFFNTDKSFIDKTGNTQGIIFNTKPPNRAIIKK